MPESSCIYGIIGHDKSSLHARRPRHGPGVAGARPLQSHFAQLGVRAFCSSEAGLARTIPHLTVYAAQAACVGPVLLGVWTLFVAFRRPGPTVSPATMPAVLADYAHGLAATAQPPGSPRPRRLRPRRLRPRRLRSRGQAMGQTARMTVMIAGRAAETVRFGLRNEMKMVQTAETGC